MFNDDVLPMMKLVDLALQIPKYTYEMQINMPKPKGQFAAVKVLDEVNPSRDKNEVIQIDEGYINRTTGVRLLKYLVVFTEGQPASSKFISAFMRPDIQDLMRKSGLCVLRHKRVENKNLTLETNWEVRESVVVECLVNRTFDSEIEVIEVVKATGEHSEGNTTIDFEIEVTAKEPK